MSLLTIAVRIAEQNPGMPADAPPSVVSQQEQQGQQEQVGYIKHEKGKGYCVKSEKNSDWSGGCYPSKGKAEDRLKQVEQFKHMKKGAVTPEDIAHDLRLVAARFANSKRPDISIVLSDLQSILGAVSQQECTSGDTVDVTVEPGKPMTMSQQQQGQQEETVKAPSDSPKHDCAKCYRSIPTGEEWEAFGSLYHKKCAPKNAHHPPK